MSVLLILSAFLIGDEWRFQLEKPSGYYVVFFTAKWCGPCQAFKRNGLEQLKQAYPVTVVDIDQEPSWRSQVDRFPTFWLCRKSDRVPIAKWMGAITPDIIRKAIPAEPEPPKPMSASGTEQGHILPLAVVALEGPSSRWSGVIISPSTILTCAHHGETSGILATVQDGRKIECAVLRSDTRVDLCLLRLSESLPVASGAMFGRDSDPAYLVGYLGGTETQMIPVTKRPDVTRINGVRVLPRVTQGPRPDSISGMSGGPVLDAAGRVVGILRCADKTTADAVRIEEIREFLQ